MARSALRGGASSVQFRAKGLAFDELVEAGRSLGKVCREFGRPLFINDRADVASACGADGLHLGPEDLPPREARRILGPEALIGVSVYGPGDLAAAQDAGAAYVALGAIFPTATKEIDVVGLEGLRRLRKRTALPIVAIGGITAASAAAVTAAGADGVAVVSALSGAADIEVEARRFRQIIDDALAKEGRGG
jgi:thiamine-phosphate pyrophosphorylase